MEFLTGNHVEPLIEASETYPKLEKAIQSAQKLVHMAYWTIDPGLSLVTAEGKERWSDLIYETAERGVTVRIIVADFDPILGRKFHESAWRSYRKFMTLRERLPDRSQKHLQIICSRHEATVGTAVRILGQAVIQSLLSKAVESLDKLSKNQGWRDVESRLSLLPGLWPYIQVDDNTISAVRSAIPTAYPAVHHEKICVIDDRTVFLGGLDINERRYDSPTHDEDLAWHDVACALEGPAATFFAEHFRRRWNDEREDFAAFVDDSSPPKGVDPLPIANDLDVLDESLNVGKTAAGQAEVAPLRTISQQAKSSFSRSPRIAKAEIFGAYKDIIGAAEDFIYIETQFLRSQAIVDCLVERALARESLEIIVLLPFVPDQLLVPGEPDIATQYGQHLQSQSIQKLRQALGDRFDAFTLIRQGTAAPDPEGDSERLERNIVYVHAKTMVVDDRIALIGSANLNDRSMLTDTETAIAWQEPGAVQAYRYRLWQHALGEDTTGWRQGFLSKWRRRAADNARKPAAERRGFVISLPEVAEKAYAKDSLVIPAELV